MSLLMLQTKLVEHQLKQQLSAGNQFLLSKASFLLSEFLCEQSL